MRNKREKTIINDFMSSLLEQFSLSDTFNQSHIYLENGEFVFEGYAIVKGKETSVRKTFKTWEACLNYSDKVNHY